MDWVDRIDLEGQYQRIRAVRVIGRSPRYHSRRETPVQLETSLVVCTHFEKADADVSSAKLLQGSSQQRVAESELSPLRVDSQAQELGLITGKLEHEVGTERGLSARFLDDESQIRSMRQSLCQTCRRPGVRESDAFQPGEVGEVALMGVANHHRWSSAFSRSGDSRWTQIERVRQVVALPIESLGRAQESQRLGSQRTWLDKRYTRF